MINSVCHYSDFFDFNDKCTLRRNQIKLVKKSRPFNKIKLSFRVKSRAEKKVFGKTVFEKPDLQLGCIFRRKTWTNLKEPKTFSCSAALSVLCERS